MKEFSVSLKEKFRRLDFVVLICALGMTALSLVTLAGAANEYGSRYVIAVSYTHLDVYKRQHVDGMIVQVAVYDRRVEAYKT